MLRSELQSLCCPPTIVRVINSRMEEGRSAFKILIGKTIGLGVDGNTMLQWIFIKIGIHARNLAQERDYWITEECGTEPPASISYGVN